MEVLFVTSEATPFVKTGGLADVCGSLPKSLAKLNCKVNVVLPLYRKIDASSLRLEGKIKVPIRDTEKVASVFSYDSTKGRKYFFIEDEDKQYYNRDYLYGTPKGEYPDNAERFYFFSRAVYEATKNRLLGRPQIIHSHDWQTALLPLFIKLLPFLSGEKRLIKTVFTIHNLGYQGIFPASILELFSNLDKNYLFSWERLEFWGRVNFMKAGIIYANAIITVSPSYCEEIKSEAYGCGLDKLLSFYSNKLFGILNGIDYEEFSPKNDKFIAFPYSKKDIRLKEKNKESLMKELNLRYQKDEPLLGMVARLTEQKGIELLIKIIPDIFKYPLKLVILGEGEERFKLKLEELQTRYKDKLRVKLEFNEALAHKIYAGIDILLLPSLYEPCGIAQFIAFSYGTIPLAYKIGGLKDTIEEFDPLVGKGDGFLFSSYNKEAFLNAIKKALYIYKHKKDWRRLQYNALSKNFSWERSAREYISVYKKILACSWEY